MRLFKKIDKWMRTEWDGTVPSKFSWETQPSYTFSKVMPVGITFILTVMALGALTNGWFLLTIPLVGGYIAIKQIINTKID